MIVNKKIRRIAKLTYQVLGKFCTHRCYKRGPGWHRGSVLCIIPGPNQLQVPAWIVLVDVVAYRMGGKHTGPRIGTVSVN